MLPEMTGAMNYVCGYISNIRQTSIHRAPSILKLLDDYVMEVNFREERI